MPHLHHARITEDTARHGAMRGTAKMPANWPPAPAKAGAANWIRCRPLRNRVLMRLGVISRAALVNCPG